MKLVEGGNYLQRGGQLITLDPPSELTEDERDHGFVHLGSDGSLYNKQGQWLNGKYPEDPRNLIPFVKPIDRVANMFNGHRRVFFDDGAELILMVNKKHGRLVLPRRKRAYARQIGAIA